MEIEMEPENTSRKRSPPLTTLEIQGNIKSKKLQMMWVRPREIP